MSGHRAPIRIQRHRTKGWLRAFDVVCVGRPSRWGNPYVIERPATGRYAVSGPGHFGRGQFGPVEVDDKRGAAAAAVLQYRTWLTVLEVTQPERYSEYLDGLAGRNLACWCPLDWPCHADVLIELANEQETKR